MLICLDLCFHMLMCLDLCFACFMPSSMYLCTPCHVCVLRPRLCLSCHVLLQPFCHFTFLSCVLAYWFELDLDPMVFVIVHTPWPISKGLDHPYLHVCACLLLCFMLVLASLVLGFATFDALSGYAVVWLYPTHKRPCLDVTTWEASPDVGLLCVNPFLFCSARWYACHAYLRHPLAFYASLHACLHVLA